MDSCGLLRFASKPDWTVAVHSDLPVSRIGWLWLTQDETVARRAVILVYIKKELPNKGNSSYNLVRVFENLSNKLILLKFILASLN